jgi:hypothetical protein
MAHANMNAMLPTGGFFDNWFILFEQVPPPFFE